jgi:hypothetical protein
MGVTVQVEKQASIVESVGELMGGVNGQRGLIRTGGLHTVVVVRASQRTINVILAFSLFSSPALRRSLDWGSARRVWDRNLSR